MLNFDSSHFLTGEELSKQELLQLIQSAELLRKDRGVFQYRPLNGKTIALIFEKPSLRTRLSFTVAINELGGQVVELLGSQKKSEEPEDTIRVLQGMVHGLMMRTFEHSVFDRMVTKATIPIINGLSDSHHPCQALADLLTLFQRFGRLQGLKLGYVGDGNNVLHSLLLLAPLVGVDVHYACPVGYQPDPEILARAQSRALGKDMGKIKSFSTPARALRGVQAAYTDVWASMGQEGSSVDRAKAFKGYQLNMELFSKAAPDAIAMHCLPMVRGQEICDEVADHPRSALFQQAENRLHAQKALLIGLFAAKENMTAKGFEYSHVI
ncbi:MAG: ornithine carbamoyltransferase [Bdellovibrionales bacterium]|nr:ornithine carbamoyltransferase [Bdellovibrionales bacterium]